MFGVGGRRRQWRGGVAAGCAAVTLLGVTACGGGDSADSAGKGAGRSTAPAASAPAAGAHGADEARLKAAAFTEGEKAGTFTASEYTLGGPLGDAYTATPAVCQPFVSLAGDVGTYQPTAQVQRKVDVPDEMRGVTVDVTLRSYANGEAAKIMKSLDRAGKDCAAGFTEERAVATATYLKAEPAALPAVAGEAEEAKAYRFTLLDVKGQLKLYEYLTVLRSGSVTLAFRAEILDTKDFGGVPQDIVTAQWKKFRAAQEGAEFGAGDGAKDTAQGAAVKN